MAETIYALCAVTSLLCALMLARSWWVRRDRLLLWSFVCFALLAANNALLLIDLAVVPHMDLVVWRNAAGLAGVASLLFGLVWETA